MDKSCTYNKVDFSKIWEQEMEFANATTDSRKVNDAVEKAFFEKLALSYSTACNLNNDTAVISEKLHSLLGDGNDILEIGPGTGNFSLPMSTYSRSVFGIDFSEAMLRELEKNCIRSGISNIHWMCGKWEEAVIDRNVDFIVSVNSLYRIRDIQSALLKMHRHAKKGVVLIRTLQRPRFAPLYRECDLAFDECRDYMIIPNICWKNGIPANVEYLDYSVDRAYPGLDAVRETMVKDLGKTTFQANSDALLDAFRRHSTQSSTKEFIYHMACRVQFIYYTKR